MPCRTRRICRYLRCARIGARQLVRNRRRSGSGRNRIVGGARRTSAAPLSHSRTESLVRARTRARQVQHGRIDALPLPPVTRRLPRRRRDARDSAAAYQPQRTNWSAGLRGEQIAGANLVVFITDGNPNEPHLGPSNLPDGDVWVMQKAFDATGLVKSSGTRLFAVGVGNGIAGATAKTRLEAVLGPNVWSSGSLVGKDVTYVTSSPTSSRP